MKTMIEIKVWIRKGHLAKFFEYIQSCTIEVHKMTVLKIVSNKELYVFDIVYLESGKFKEFMDNPHNWYRIESIQNPFLDLLKGGLLNISGKLQVENNNDFQTKITSALELINHKIAEGEGRLFSGIDNNIAIICGVDCSVDIDERKIYEFYAKMEIESLLINNLTGLNAYPLVIRFYYPEDLVKILEAVVNSYSMLRIHHFDYNEIDLFDQMQTKFDVAMLSRELDEVPLYLLAIALKIMAQNDYHFDDTTIGFVGIDLSVKRIVRLFKQLNCRRILGYDLHEKEMMTFEKEGGLATTPENIIGNSDIIFIIKNNFDNNDFELLRPGQFLISLLDKKVFNFDYLKEYGIRELLYIDQFAFSNIVPGFIQGVLRHVYKRVDDSLLMVLAQKMTGIISSQYTWPAAYSEVHTLMMDVFRSSDFGEENN